MNRLGHARAAKIVTEIKCQHAPLAPLLRDATERAGA